VRAIRNTSPHARHLVSATALTLALGLALTGCAPTASPRVASGPPSSYPAFVGTWELTEFTAGVPTTVETFELRSGSPEDYTLTWLTGETVQVPGATDVADGTGRVELHRTPGTTEVLAHGRLTIIEPDIGPEVIELDATDLATVAPGYWFQRPLRDLVRATGPQTPEFVTRTLPDGAQVVEHPTGIPVAYRSVGPDGLPEAVLVALDLRIDGAVVDLSGVPAGG
jgi:hypothetical protein